MPHGWSAVGCLFFCACLPPATPPTCVTPLGIKVYLFGQQFSPQAIDASFSFVAEEFSDLYAPTAAYDAAPQASVSFLPVDDYDLYGRKVAGNLSPDATFLYIGAQSRRLPQTALAHEWIHFLDMHLRGQTDDSHASWTHRIYPGLEKVNQRLETDICALEGCAP